MAAIQISSSSSRPTRSMNHAALLSTKLLLSSALRRRPFCTLPLHLCANSANTRQTTTTSSSGSGGSGGPRGAMLCGPRSRATSRPSDGLLKEEWLDSLSFPFDERPSLIAPGVAGEPEGHGSEAGWVIGVDPDVSGAVALLKPDAEGCRAQVFDTPHVQVLVGKRIRKRLDARSIIQLLQSFHAPLGTAVYIEQSIPFPQDGKQGWWSGGFTYGLWLGILVASGFSVVPVTSHVWKDRFELYGSSITKDDSRKAASILFPSLDSFLKRKKDHGRAEALLIAAYGKGLKIHPELVVSQEALSEMKEI